MSELDALLRFAWHPVCTLAELSEARPGGNQGPSGPRQSGNQGPKQVTLLGQKLAIAIIDGQPVALNDRCAHRSTSLSIGTVEDGGLRCAYHGWCYGADGKCTDIPALVDGPIPPRARVDSYAVQVAYDLVWVCLDDRAQLPVPVCPAFGDDTLRVLVGAPYTWPVAAPRRVENFVDLSHFAFVHDGSLGSRNAPVPPVPSIERAAGELLFNYDPPDLVVDPTALFGHSRYRMPMPCTVNIEFILASGARRLLWMTASPVTHASCRSFWFVSRSDAWDEPDDDHMAFQARILAEDESVVCSQDPPEMVLDANIELSVRTDRVSIEYRRWLRELAAAAISEPSALRRALLLDD
ncbi:MAG: aromatic ring-hydroxylating dioxygenase subunit alpha [Acidimicrobiales bacterium]